MRVPEMGAQKQGMGGGAYAKARASTLAWAGWRSRLRRKASRFDVKRPGCCPAAADNNQPPVPPTVSPPSMRSVGWPTPTGTLCPSLPHTPTPWSRARSLPIIDT